MYLSLYVSYVVVDVITPLFQTQMMSLTTKNI